MKNSVTVFLSGNGQHMLSFFDLTEVLRKNYTFCCFRITVCFTEGFSVSACACRSVRDFP